MGSQWMMDHLLQFSLKKLETASQQPPVLLDQQQCHLVKAFLVHVFLHAMS